MKTNLKLLLGLLIAISITTSAYAGVLPVKNAHNMIALSKHKLSKLKKADTYTYLFAYDTYQNPNPDSSGYYTVKVYFIGYDETDGSYTNLNAPQDITITVPSGFPAAGNYTFPSGASSHVFGEFYFGTSPETINITTNPTSLSGTPIYQTLEYFD